MSKLIPVLRLLFGSLVLGVGAYICLSLAWGVVHGEQNILGSHYGSATDLVASIAFLIAGAIILSGNKRPNQ